MKKLQERTLGTRLSNAQDFATKLAGFKNYRALGPNTTLEHFNQLLSLIQQSNNASASGKLSWSMAVDQRQQLFSDDAKSIRRLLAPINAAVKAQYGIRSKAATEVRSRVKSLRGIRANAIALKAKVAGDTTTDKRISVSHQAMGSIAKSFADVVTIIGELSPAFDPTDTDLSVNSLRQKHAKIEEVGQRMSNGYAAWKTALAGRDQHYAELFDCSLHIKEVVKAQYGVSSTEYSLIKSIRL
ncbi:MAG: hypothetical protein ABJA78_17850 [Ferruginibacter sp.]